MRRDSVRQHRSPLDLPTLALSDQCPLAISLSRPLTLSHSLCIFFPSPPLSRSCGHAFHAACLEHYFATSLPGQRPRCPYCRSSVHAPLPVEARAVSGLPLEPVAAPRRGGLCHFDRHYRFLDLGDFGRAGMLYLLSSNEDRKTASSAVMWVVEARDAAEGMRPRCEGMRPRCEGMRPRDVIEMWHSLRERLGACAVHHPPQLPLGEARGRGAAGGVAAGQGLRAKRRAPLGGELRRPERPLLGPCLLQCAARQSPSCLGLVILLCAAAHRQPRVLRRC